MESVKYCHKCGFACKLQDRFCSRCGARLAEHEEGESAVMGAAENVQPTLEEFREIPPPEPAGVTPTQEKAAAGTGMGAPAEPAAAKPVPAPPGSLPGIMRPPIHEVAAPPLPPSSMFAPGRRPFRAAAPKAPLSVLGSLAQLLGGVVIFLSVFLVYSGGPGRSLTGWDWFRIGNMTVSGGGDIGTPFFVHLEGYPVFTGLAFLVLGGMLTITGFINLVLGNKKTAAVGLILSLLVLATSVVNLTSFLRQPGAGVGAGIILVLLFALFGGAGGVINITRRGQTQKPHPSLATTTTAAPRGT